jgi:hypothetical protein
MSKRFTPLSTAIALATASVLIGGCAMQTRNAEMARADTEDASHPSTNTTLTAQGDPVPDVITQVALVEQPAPPVQVAQAEPMPANPQSDYGATSPVAAADTSTQAQPSAYVSTPAPSTTATNSNSSYSNADQAQPLPPRPDRN